MELGFFGKVLDRCGRYLLIQNRVALSQIRRARQLVRICLMKSEPS